MQNKYLYSREELADLIKKAPTTKDGFFFFPRFRYLIKVKGNKEDKGYYFNRELFFEKIVFSKEDINLLISKSKMPFDSELYEYLNKKINNCISGCEYLELKDFVFNEQYTLEELIDNCIFTIKNKYDELI